MNLRELTDACIDALDRSLPGSSPVVVVHSKWTVETADIEVHLQDGNFVISLDASAGTTAAEYITALKEAGEWHP